MALTLDGDNQITGPLTVGFGAGQVTTNLAAGLQALNANTTGIENTGIGYQALYANTIGVQNAAVGRGALTANTTGSYNAAVGAYALYSNTIGTNVTGVGGGALFNNTTGNSNTAIGTYAMFFNVTGSNNTAVGQTALNKNTVSSNTAVGYQALTNNTTGTPNDAFGVNALAANTTGANNTAVGTSSLATNTTGSSNVAMGKDSLGSNTTGISNVAVGVSSLVNNTTGAYNVAVGQLSGASVTIGTNNTFVGYAAGYNTTALTTGAGNTCIGTNAHTSSVGAQGQIVIGNGSVGQGDNYVSLGSGGTNYIYNQYTVNATWTKASDERIKQNITDLDIGLNFINELKVKSYNWKPSNEIPEDIIGYSEENTQDTEVTMYGMIAQDVKAAMDKLGYEHFGGWNVREADGLQGLSNEMFVLPLINAVKELAARVAALEAQLAAKA